MDCLPQCMPVGEMAKNSNVENNACTNIMNASNPSDPSLVFILVGCNCSMLEVLEHWTWLFRLWRVLGSNFHLFFFHYCESMIRFQNFQMNGVLCRGHHLKMFSEFLCFHPVSQYVPEDTPSEFPKFPWTPEAVPAANGTTLYPTSFAWNCSLA